MCLYIYIEREREREIHIFLNQIYCWAFELFLSWLLQIILLFAMLMNIGVHVSFQIRVFLIPG